MNRNQKVVFGVGETLLPGVKSVILGVPKAAWEYMREGRTHTFDLTKVGMPIQIILFGGPTHDECMGMIGGRLQDASADRREEDFSVLPPREAFIEAIQDTASPEEAADAVVALLRRA